MKKYEELYKYSKEALAEELNRFVRADKKASRLINILTFLIGLYGYFCKELIENIYPPENCIETIMLFLLVAELVLLLVSWFNHFEVLRRVSIKKLTINEEFIDFFKKNKLINIYVGLSNENSNAFMRNKRIADRKYDLLESGYEFISYSLIGVLVIMFLYIILCI